jgi:putative hemolysin
MFRFVEASAESAPPRRLVGGWGANAGIPPWLARLAGKVAGVDDLRGVYEEIGATSSPIEFAQRALQVMRITCSPDDAALSRIPGSGRCLFVANHPFGALDGLIAIALLGARRPDLRLLANFELALIPELAPLILPVDPFAASRTNPQNSRALRQGLRWLEQEHALIIFPAGEVAHFDARAHCVTDPPWTPITGRLAQLTEAPVVPIHFAGQNSALFQVAGLISPHLRTLMLPRELRQRRGSRIEVRIGDPISAKRLARLRSNEAVAIHLRLKTYLSGILPAAEKSTPRPPIERELSALPPEMPTDALEREIGQLPETCLLLKQGEYQVFLADAPRIPFTLSEIGRLRELTFRAVGEGTGRERDLDRFDRYYDHLFIWDQAKRLIVGAYRVGRTDVIRRRFGKQGLYTSTLFEYREPFLQLLGPALELGRSFVRAEYQRSFAPLMLLWKGIGEVVGRDPRYCRLIGPVSVSGEYAQTSKHLLISYLRTHCTDRLLAHFVSARNPFSLARSHGSLETEIAMLSAVDPLAALVEDLENDSKSVPVLLRQYLKLGGKVLAFNVDADFGHSIDCLLMVDLRHSKPRALRKYMSEATAARFERSFRRLHPKEAAELAAE